MERKKGVWTQNKQFHNYFACSECKKEIVTNPYDLKEEWKFCPVCGSEMEYQEPERSKEVFVERKLQMEIEWSSLMVGDRIGDFVVLKVDGNTATIQQFYNCFERAFDTDVDKNLTYENSEIKEYLKADYMADYEDQKLMQEIELRRISDWDLLTRDDIDPEKTKYPLYEDIKNLPKFDEDGEISCWWIQDVRSAFRGIASYVWHVSTSGTVSNTHAHSGLRLAPACVINLS